MNEVDNRFIFVSMLRIAIECKKCGHSKREFMDLSKEIWAQVAKMDIKKAEDLLEKIMREGTQNLMDKKDDLADDF